MPTTPEWEELKRRKEKLLAPLETTGHQIYYFFSIQQRLGLWQAPHIFLKCGRSLELLILSSQHILFLSLNGPFSTNTEILSKSRKRKEKKSIFAIHNN